MKTQIIRAAKEILLMPVMVVIYLAIASVILILPGFADLLLSGIIPTGESRPK